MLAHRKFDITSPIGNNAREFILNRFMPETADVDVMIGYRADDSYFSFAEDFVNDGADVIIKADAAAEKMSTLFVDIVANM